MITKHFKQITAVESNILQLIPGHLKALTS